MGIYLNSKRAYQIYQNEKRRPYFVDKTMLLTELFPAVEQGTSYVCITRPRRFGKTVAANMLAAFFGKGYDSSALFGNLNVAKKPGYEEHLNRHNVISVDFSEVPRNCRDYGDYIERIERILLKDLIQAYPAADIDMDDAVWDALKAVFAAYDGEKFIFVLDEWDAVFHMPFLTKQDESEYLRFLRNLLKDQPYVSLAYMTGILPITKYSSGSELNMFAEYTMVTETRFSDYFGFTSEEVDYLYQKFCETTPNPSFSREDLRIWYDGYHTKSGDRLYNPRSIVLSLTNNNLGNYWTSSGPYDEIFYYIEQNVDDVRNDLALMAAGEAVPAAVREYAATSMNLTTREEIFSAMVVYGFLSYEDGRVSIPNKELMDKFDEMIKKETGLGYVNRLAKESDRMLAATLAGDTDTMAEILAYAHNTETPMLSYNNEAELAAVVNLVYLSARDRYRIEREDKAGIGFVDFIFYPYKRDEDCIILELKVDYSPETAIRQIREKQYALRFAGRLGEEAPYTGRIIAVGISYDRESKDHRCKIELL